MRRTPADLDRLRAAAGEAGALLRALSNETRLLVLCELASGERSVGELERVVGIGQSALSQHLAKLRAEGLVRTRREAQTIHYALADDRASRVIAVLYDIYCAPSGDPDGRERDQTP